MAKNMKLTEKEWFKNKKYNTKTNKRIKEYPKVTHHREKWVWMKNDI